VVIRRLCGSAGVALLGLGGILLACNSLLGIDSALLEPDASNGAASPDAPTEDERVDGGVTGTDADSAPVADNDASGPSADADSATEDEAFAADPCGTYCRLVNQNCTIQYQEYLPTEVMANVDVCLKLCSYMSRGTYSPYPDGTPEKKDTIACRLWHANAAGDLIRNGMGAPATHCKHAGPLGSEECCEQCDPCQKFCDLDWHYCSEEATIATALRPYGGDVTKCIMACSSDAGFPYVPPYDLNDPGGKPFEQGNTLNCRLWHLEKAITSHMPEIHCPHTDQSGGGPSYCGP